MQKLNRSLSAAVLALAVAGGGYAFLGSSLTPAVQAHLRDHPKLAEADEALHDAIVYLKEAPHDFHGHKAAAIHAMEEARERISLAVRDEEKRSSLNDIHAVPLESKQHAKLHVAHEKLKEAREYLKESKHDFHGHREEALKAVDEAMRHLKIVMED